MVTLKRRTGSPPPASTTVWGGEPAHRTVRVVDLRLEIDLDYFPARTCACVGDVDVEHDSVGGAVDDEAFVVGPVGPTEPEPELSGPLDPAAVPVR